eukprot:312280_1
MNPFPYNRSQLIVSCAVIACGSYIIYNAVKRKNKHCCKSIDESITEIIDDESTIVNVEHADTEISIDQNVTIYAENPSFDIEKFQSLQDILTSKPLCIKDDIAIMITVFMYGDYRETYSVYIQHQNEGDDAPNYSMIIYPNCFLGGDIIDLYYHTYVYQNQELRDKYYGDRWSIGAVVNDEIFEIEQRKFLNEQRLANGFNLVSDGCQLIVRSKQSIWKKIRLMEAAAGVGLSEEIKWINIQSMDCNNKKGNIKK